MAQLVVYFMLANVFAAAALAHGTVQPEVSAPGPSPSPTIQIARKLGAPPTPSQSHSSGATSRRLGVEAREESKSGDEHQHQSDKSVTGGKVILGGLATTFLVAIFCYIRATRRLSKAAKAADQSPALPQLP